MKLLEHLYSQLSALDNVKTFVIAYSGGLDSQVLLHATCLLKSRLKQSDPHLAFKAIHVHHGLSQYADEWLAFCQAQCEARDIAFIGKRVTVADVNKVGVEAAARQARYDAIIQACDTGSVVLTAHHAQDQLETILLQLKRGRGPKGLSGIAKQRQLSSEISVCRPLLDYDRQELEAFAEEHELTWIEDDSNTDERFDRNFLRHQIIPLMQERWPSICKTAQRSAEQCADNVMLLDEVVQTKLLDIVNESGGLSLTALATESHAWQKQLVRGWLQKRDMAMPSDAQLNQLLNLMQAKDDAEPLVVVGNYHVRRFHSHLYAFAPEDMSLHPINTIPNTVCDWRLQEHDSVENSYWTLSACALPERLETAHNYVCLAPPVCSIITGQQEAVTLTLPEGTVLSFGHLTARFKPENAQMSKPLKQWLKLWKVAPWVRKHIPLLMYGNEIQAVLLKDRVVVKNLLQ
ncbi:tRNA lysidine(34) synthetase TilS [Aestuariibacter sp. AA17]|uniref:tRNA(Ile)-lysidine synthase n=1 Tax=Fluctibacter corallii TaxID=2984329 RepID=A0ABT3A8K6_9ALTE|nr:tRNA lysidine(34) synthetase TilS [Aestuariibacter sp. AA17]MCV2885006.1 tRNA lysidine(34) synthetase TilS [Aestuariibacter sp. AA17]